MSDWEQNVRFDIQQILLMHPKPSALRNLKWQDSGTRLNPSKNRPSILGSRLPMRFEIKFSMYKVYPIV